MHDSHDSARCAIIWVIFLAPLSTWTLLTIPYLRAVYVAIKFNKAIDDLLLGSLEHEDHAEVAQLANYLASLHQLGKLHIAPFGLKLSYANVLQAFIGGGTALTQVAVRAMKH